MLRVIPNEGTYLRKTGGSTSGTATLMTCPHQRQDSADSCNPAITAGLRSLP